MESQRSHFLDIQYPCPIANSFAKGAHPENRIHVPGSNIQHMFVVLFVLSVFFVFRVGIVGFRLTFVGF